MSQTDNEQVPANGLYVGEIRLLPFRHDELPFGWHFCNGERFLLTSPQGEVLSGLSENFRADWGLEEDLCSISLPNFFEQDGGYGLFLRAADGQNRRVGSFEADAQRRIQGEINCTYAVPRAPGRIAQSALTFTQGEGATRTCPSYSAKQISDYITLDTALNTPTGPRNIPANLGMTPAIYLGV